MIQVQFTAPDMIIIFNTDYKIKSVSIADSETIDIELNDSMNIWTTSFNINSVQINGLTFDSSVQMLGFLNQK
jgi:hypothetical protein